jgi:hypothetical protein
MKIEYTCSFCNKDAELEFTIYAHDEFFCDENCNHCGAKIPQNVLDKIYDDEPVNWIASKIDYAHDMMKDR